MASCAWLQFLVGCHDVAAKQQYLTEYRTQLDLHALGITAVQVLSQMLPNADEGAPGNEPEAAAGPPRSPSASFLEFREVRLAWDKYWGRVLPLHLRLVDTFTNCGDWDMLKAELLRDRVHLVVAIDLENLRTALSRAGDACRQSRADGLRASGLFNALLALIGTKDGTAIGASWGPMRWKEVRCMANANK